MCSTLRICHGRHRFVIAPRGSGVQGRMRSETWRGQRLRRQHGDDAHRQRMRLGRRSLQGARGWLPRLLTALRHLTGGRTDQVAGCGRRPHSCAPGGPPGARNAPVRRRRAMRHFWIRSDARRHRGRPPEPPVAAPISFGVTTARGLLHGCVTRRGCGVPARVVRTEGVETGQATWRGHTLGR